MGCNSAAASGAESSEREHNSDDSDDSDGFGMARSLREHCRSDAIAHGNDTGCSAPSPRFVDGYTALL
ncbi:Hypothetical Protein XCAW_00733 [Xanthomonas citri subsp. citri Aw12879]|nr:Hypothetical Protein XCAW_00733 [Xanthomonas citri subsp. citri Aw12879]